MDPGGLNKRIRVVIDQVSGRDGAGAPTVIRQQIARPWAKVTHAGGKEFLQADGQSTERKVVFKVYPTSAITMDALIEYQGLDHVIQDLVAFDDALEVHTVSRAQAAP